MDIKTGFFYIFSLVLLFAALRVITARNPVHAVLFLMLSFSQAAAIWLMLRAEFLAITLVLVYLGAVMVLFLFVVMMLDIRIDRLRAGFWRHMPLALLLGAVVALEMGALLILGFPQVEPAAAPASAFTAKALGILLYTEYLMPIQIAAAILLVAMIAAIALTLRERKDSKAIDPALQVRVRAADRRLVVQVPAAQVAAAAPTQANDSENAA